MDALLLYTQIILKSDFDMLGDKAYEVYSKIILLCKMTDNNDKVEMFKKKMQEYAKEHGIDTSKARNVREARQIIQKVIREKNME